MFYPSKAVGTELAHAILQIKPYLPPCKRRQLPTFRSPYADAQIQKQVVRATGEHEDNLEKVLLNELIASRRQVDRLLDQQNLLLSLVAQGIPPQTGRTPTSSQAQGALEQGSPSQCASPAPKPGSAARQPRDRLPAATKRLDISSGNPVADVLAQSGTLPSQRHGDSIEDTVLSHIQTALSAVDKSDVLADLPSSMLPSSSSSSKAAASMAPSERPSAAKSSDAISPNTLQAALSAVDDMDVLADLPPFMQPSSSETSPQASAAHVTPQESMHMVPQPELPSSGASLTGEAGELVPLPLLRLGDTSAFWIEILQIALMALGHKVADEGFTFGPATAALVKRYQADNQLPETGVADATTWGSLLARLPQLRQDTIAKVASGTAAAVVEWGRNNPGSSLGGVAASTSAPNSSSPGSSRALSGSTTGTNPRSSFNCSDLASQSSSPVGVNFFSDISDMAANEAREMEGGSSSSSSSSSDDERGSSMAESSCIEDNLLGTAKTDSSRSRTSGEDNSTKGAQSRAQSTDKSSSGDGDAAMKGLPELSLGDDDIEWVSVLHRGLQSAGYYPSDEECENWLFGEGTQEALLTMQACHGLPETGTVDARTWDVLLSIDKDLLAEAHVRVASVVSAGPASRSPGCPIPAAAKEQLEQSDDEGWVGDREVAHALSNAPSGSKWPVLTEMEGGKDVQLMQLALSSQGYNCGEDDMQYWMFGDMTGNALRTFQACAGLKETGVCDERTWKALLRDQKATPEDLPRVRERLLAEMRVRGDIEDYVEDITEGKEGKVWLLGEQRWSK